MKDSKEKVSWLYREHGRVFYVNIHLCNEFFEPLPNGIITMYIDDGIAETPKYPPILLFSFLFQLPFRMEPNSKMYSAIFTSKAKITPILHIIM